jgi:hypothetical protein
MVKLDERLSNVLLVLIVKFDELLSEFLMYSYMGYSPNEPIHDEG